MNRVIGFVRLVDRERIATTVRAEQGYNTKLAVLVQQKSDPLPNNTGQSYFQCTETTLGDRRVVNLNTARADVPFGISMFPDEVDRQKIFSNLDYYKSQEPVLRKKLIESEFNLDGLSVTSE